MLVGELLPLVKLRLDSLNISNDDSIMLSFINLGMSELYRRFNLSIKSETITCNDDIALYELRNDNVLMLLTVYDKFGKELKQSDVLDSLAYDYKIINYRSFVLRKPFNGYLYAVYKASPIILKDKEDEIDLPTAMIGALLDYCAYMGHSTLQANSQNTREFGVHLQLFENSCNQLDAQGYRIPINTETVAIQARGFV